MKYKIQLTLLIFLVAITGCQDFQEIEKNPNQAGSVPASLVLTGVMNDMLDDGHEEPWSLEHRWNQFWCCNYNYYGTNEYSWTNATLKYQTIKNILKMEDEAVRTGAPEKNVYAALGKFLKAYFFVKMTLQVGDIPMQEALQGLDNISPAYDSQKDVYIGVLEMLDEANDDMKDLIESGDDTFSGDLFMNNELSQWRKVVNSFQLRVLVSLSAKENDGDLNIKNRFSSILNNPTKYPLLEGPGDNLEIEYNGTTTLYPNNPGSRGFDKGRYNMASTYVKTLTDLHDPRVFVTCNPAKAKLQGGAAYNDFAAYVGANSGESLDDMTFKAGNGDYSYANQYRYYGTYAGPEPALLLGYAEQCFNIAEGINRGWASGNAEDYYKAGINASMKFYDIEDGASLTVRDQEDVVLGEVVASITDYLAQPDVAYKGDNEDGLAQILTQKYIAFFQNSGLEAFYNQRRTGIPEFAIGVGTGNGCSGSNCVLPLRWLYPSAEKTTNGENLNAALMRQFGTDDDSKNKPLWIIQN